MLMFSNIFIRGQTYRRNSTGDATMSASILLGPSIMWDYILALIVLTWDRGIEL